MPESGDVAEADESAAKFAGRRQSRLKRREMAAKD
jgi:hypothetical protein